MVYIAFTTVSKRSDARKLARLLLDARAAACVNILPGTVSVYCWRGKRCEDSEFLLIIKTTKAALPRLKRVLEKNHPYEVHELVAWPVSEGNAAYLRWVGEECRKNKKRPRE
ncbi:MAG: divalent-cation tolerance protein CutA [Acidobacteriota bacterium]|nr:MAG: divalent-cation tolerance protein CutA [Acidobacteriota bacterium]